MEASDYKPIITYPVVIIIVFTFLFLLYIKFYHPIRNFEDFENISIYNSSHFNRYINSIHDNMKSVKLAKPYNNFKKDYSNRLHNIPPKYYDMINFYTKKVNVILSNYSIFNKYPWKFLISTNQLEKGMPFTIHDTIIIPFYMLKNIDSQYKQNTINELFINTLIHEKIHIVQRFNQDVFNNFYKKHYKFVGGIYNKNLDNTRAKYHMNNPDSNNQLWTYNLGNKPYLVYLKNKGGSP